MPFLRLGGIEILVSSWRGMEGCCSRLEAWGLVCERSR